MQIEQGKYRGKIRDYGVFHSTAGNQHPTVFVTFETIGQYDPSTGQIVECPRVTRTYNKAITPNTIDWLLSDLKAIGYDRDSFTYLDPEVPGAVNLFGRELDVVCEHESYEGAVRERWSIYREPSRKKLAPEELAQLDAQYAPRLKKASGNDTSVAAPAPVSNTSDELF